MKYTLTLKFLLGVVALVFFSISSSAQAKPTTEGDYNGTFTYAVSETNSAYPVIFKWEAEEFTNGRLVRRSTDEVENESAGRHRSTKTITENGKTRVVYEILVSFGNGFCKEGDGAWRRSQYVCLGPSVLSIPRAPESVEYSVEDKKLDGKNVKVYRKYSVFSSEKGKGAKKTFEEQISTIDSDGYFISVVDTTGTLSPKEIERKQTETWIVRAKIKPIAAPIK